MSSRYVWEKHEIGVSEAKTGELASATVQFSGTSGAPSTTAANEYTTEVYDDGTINVAVRAVGGSTVVTSGAPAARSSYKYLLINNQTGWSKYRLGDGPVSVWEATTTSGNWSRSSGSGGKDNVSSGGPYIRHSFSTGAGELIQNVSAQYSTSYPSNSTSNGYWYVYLGSDSIDPTAVGYSTDAPKGGEAVTVTVTPAANTYGGTIRYQYQYQTDGGAWTNSGEATDATTKSITVPKGAETFSVRVLASDDWGFTSTDYVHGSTLTVQNLIAYIGVNGVAREIDKMYIGVNGVAREVVAAYIGVNGVARELF